MTTAILIPARLASSRFPQKMLADLNGLPLIKHVYNRCLETGYDVFVLTDRTEIFDVFDRETCILTQSNHKNGTSRCMEVIDDVLKYDQYINVQGDMPDITVDIIKAVEQKLDSCDVATAYTKMNDEDRNDPNVVKMIHNGDRAHWFLRAKLDYGDRHLGIYGYTKFAKKLYEVTEKFLEEDLESLEQLRWIQNSVKIGVTPVEFNGIEINTPEDLKQWNQVNCH
jgi:3-deoxy-manno-octulosonate cytidylyltransferase (CMP-KDO synthetase)